MTIALRDIDYFVTIAEHGNLGRAAEALKLSQPALSKSLRRLERGTQTKLVRKTARGVELTAVGTAFLAHVRRIRLSLHDVEHEVADLAQGRAGHVRLGANYYLSEYVLPRVCGALLDESPKISMQVGVGANDVLVPALRNGQFDLIVSTASPYPEDDLEQVYLCDIEGVICASPRHRLAKMKQIAIADLTGEKWTLSVDPFGTSWLRRAFTEKGFPPPQVWLDTSSPALKLKAASCSQLLSFAPRVTIRDAPPGFPLVELPVKGLVLRRPLAARYRKDSYLSPAARRLIELLKVSAQELGSLGRTAPTASPNQDRPVERFRELL